MSGIFRGIKISSIKFSINQQREISRTFLVHIFFFHLQIFSSLPYRPHANRLKNHRNSGPRSTTSSSSSSLLLKLAVLCWSETRFTALSGGRLPRFCGFSLFWFRFSMDRGGGSDGGSCYYTILGIRKDASFSDIRTAYRKLALVLNSASLFFAFSMWNSIF